MSKVIDPKIYRVLDANFNRAKEGLRVCEDICRFIYDRKAMTKSFKDLRHDLTAAMQGFKWRDVITNRNVEADVGKSSSITEMKRNTVKDIMYANLQRVKESVRVLEEFAKLLSKQAARDFKKIRYQIYHLERNFAQKF
jgi:thiamine-phosphate pyrophosphorylase